VHLKHIVEVSIDLVAQREYAPEARGKEFPDFEEQAMSGERADLCMESQVLKAEGYTVAQISRHFHAAIAHL
jgi:hypothetical protein